MKILTIAGSNSQTSINRQLAKYTATLFNAEQHIDFDLSVHDIPLFSPKLENELGTPSEVILFAEQIDEADLIILSLAEHNGSFSAAFKNLLDWTSRIKDRKTFNNKPMLLMATSPGARGGQTVLEMAKNILPYQGTEILNYFSLPSFYENFEQNQGFINQKIKVELQNIILDIKSKFS
jgi:chromate reductase, NAD(P)H dehydrogenase (quinone)